MCKSANSRSPKRVSLVTFRLIAKRPLGHEVRLLGHDAKYVKKSKPQKPIKRERSNIFESERMYKVAQILRNMRKKFQKIC